ncbi:MAG: AAA family ATPase [Janthinobacterium lividum]
MHNTSHYIGQRHLLGPGKPHSMILWGPPGAGKPTPARLTAYAAVEQAEHYLQQGKHLILFIDQIHCFNKAARSMINQGLARRFMQIFGPAHCPVGGSHA